MASSIKAVARKKGAKGKPHRFEMQKLDDGSFTSRTYHKPPRSASKNAMMDMDLSPLTAAHKSLDDVHDHIDQVFGGDQGAGAGEPDADDTAAASPADEEE